MPLARTDSGIAYQVDGSGPSIALIHGWCCDRAAMAPLRDDLAGSHRVISVDLRGHGASGRAIGPADHCGDVADGLAHAGLTAPIISIGHSMGALVAVGLLARGAIDRAVLLDPAPIATRRARTFWADAASALRGPEAGAWRSRFIARQPTPGREDVTREVCRTMAATATETAIASASWMAGFDAARAMADAGHRAGGNASRQVLLVRTPDSEDPGPLRELHPGLQVVTLPVGHFVHLEARESTARAIREFLET